MKTFLDFNIEIPTWKTSGNVKTFCPQCRDRRTNQRDKSLSVNLDKGIWHCHYCEWSGSLHVGERTYSVPVHQYRRPIPNTNTQTSSRLIEWFKTRGISKETIDAMKIVEGTHVMPQSGKAETTIQFPFYLKDELINVKYRTYDKSFMLESGAELIPYNVNSIEGENKCIITEGEMDCLSFIEAGYLSCVSVPNGASSNLTYLDDFIEGWFDDKWVIYIAVDTDQKGLLLREELVRRFGMERCRIVTYGDGCKDANEHLMKYGADSLAECIDNAKEVKEEGVFTISDFEDSLDAIYNSGFQRGAVVGLSNFDPLCSFETKRLAVITGIPGSGKSEFLDEIAERLNIRYGWRFAFFSPENAPLAYHAGKLIEKFTGMKFDFQTLAVDEYTQAKNHLNRNMFFISPKDDFSLESILTKAKFLVRRYGVKAVVIDPFNRLTLNKSREKETDMIRDILNELTKFAQQNDVLVFLMAHPAKQHRNAKGVIEAPTLYDISGSAHFFNMADYGIVVHRDRPNNLVEIRVEKIRFKHLGGVGTAKLHYNLTNGRYAPHVKGPVAWDNTNHLTPAIPASAPINNNVIPNQTQQAA